MSRPQRETQVEMLVAAMNALNITPCQYGLKQYFCLRMQPSKAITENLPAAHSTHEFTLIAFVSPEYVPA